MMKRLIVVLAMLTLTVGCSSRKVNIDYAHDADFSKYKTFAWHELDTSLAEESPLAHERVLSAVDQQMTAKGFRKVSSNPDVYVTYHAEDKENTTLDTTHMGYDGYGPGWGWGDYYGGGMGMGSSTTQVRTYKVGTLIVDMWDAKTKELVWRGIASDTVSDNPQKDADKIQKAAVELFKRYPPSVS